MCKDNKRYSSSRYFYKYYLGLIANAVLYYSVYERLCCCQRCSYKQASHKTKSPFHAVPTPSSVEHNTQQRP